jgi:hypothetical protein
VSRAARQVTQWADLRGARCALHAEWTKTRTAGGTVWLLLAVVVAATVAVGAAVATATRCPAAACGQDPAKVRLSGVDLGQATAATASPSGLPHGSSGTGSADRPAAARVNASRTSPARPASRRSQPRTVPSGTPSSSETLRWPRPSPAAARPAPITAAASALRSSSRAGSSTCVARHDRHRDRRGRTLNGTLPAPKTFRRRA